MLEEAKILCRTLNEHGFEAYVVGGTIRDILMGRKPKDIDIATDATPAEVYSAFVDKYYVAPTGEKFGTVTIVKHFTKTVLAEITTYRSEGRYSDSRHPDSVKFEKDLKKDLARRDFTMNAIAYNPVKVEFVDPFNGALDIHDGVIRTVGDPEERFREDPLRMMRMCRFVSQLGFNVEEQTAFSAGKLCHLITKISGERIRDELLKLLVGDHMLQGLESMMDTDLMEQILPEVARLKGIKQPIQHHKYTVLTHSFNTAFHLPKYDGTLRLAGLLHDVGKTKMNPTRPYFPYHADDALKMLPSILKRLKLSNQQSDFVTFLVQHHMDGFNYFSHMTKRGNRRYLSKIKNLEWLKDLQALIHADMKASGLGKDDVMDGIGLWFSQLYTMIREKEPFSKKDLAINGHDLIKLGIPPSKVLGDIQQALLAEVIDDPKLNNRKYLLERAKSYMKRTKYENVS